MSVSQRDITEFPAEGQRSFPSFPVLSSANSHPRAGDALKIDLIITELEVGGAERCCMELATYLHRNYHAVRIISIGSPPKPPRDAFHREVRSQKVPFVSLYADRALQFPLAWWRLRRFVRTQPPDIAQSFLWHANVLSAGVYPSFGIPLVGGNRVTEPRTGRHRWGKWAASRMKKLVCVSEEVATWTSQIEEVEASKLLVIPNGISLSRWEASSQRPCLWPDSLPKDAPVLLFVGRIDYQKGFDVLIERIPRILGALPDHHWVLLGDGPERVTAQRQIARTAVAERVHWLGQSEEVAQWMRRSQLLVLPTRYEGMPNVVLEAMASSLPVATLEVEGVRELLGSNTTEQSVGKSDWEAWESLVIRLATDRDRAKELGVINRQRVESTFALHEQLKQYEALYRTLIR
ncbi:Glycogen synthase [Pirellula sp. SH-Sr6A]|uniref:glycosyltransferase family 4 protein n=1 Tax=Pirellula sp. SH-Sr6A TaxID=1632865 RepID=UPI00078C7BF7|nr:glycosyltransferase family 4 protein [Pirellula sp. SH-Sr6A]AMV33353.1 Glycogen synthase [Pirellula sp. SH-Sr6A]